MVTKFERTVMQFKITNAARCKICKYECQKMNIYKCFFKLNGSNKIMRKTFEDSKKSYNKRNYSTSSNNKKENDMKLMDTTMYGLGVCSMIITIDVVLINVITKAFYYFWK